jgi:hypothetical protein
MYFSFRYIRLNTVYSSLNFKITRQISIKDIENDKYDKEFKNFKKNEMNFYHI